jgi:hypothetical protein
VHEVYLSDRNMTYDNATDHFIDAAFWAETNCKSFKRYDVQDVSDHSLLFDQVAVYYFDDEKDAMIFTLKWQQS